MKTFTFLPHMAAMWAAPRTMGSPHLPRRCGANWNDAERRHLLAGYQLEGASIPDLARRHERGAGGISAQLSRLLDDERDEVERLYAQLWNRDMRAAPHVLASPCKGRNCGTMDGRFHSRECYAERDAASAVSADEKAAVTGAAEPAPATPPSCPKSWPGFNKGIFDAFHGGLKVEYFSESKQRWKLYYDWGSMPPGDPRRAWRLYAPGQPKKMAEPVVLYATAREVNGALVLFNSTEHAPGTNLKLTFQGGVLARAEECGVPF